MTPQDVRGRIDFNRLAEHLEAGHKGASDAVVDIVEISDQLQTALKRLDDKHKAGRYTDAFAQTEAARLRAEAVKKATPLLERATTLIALADAVDGRLAPDEILRRARFVERSGNADRRLLAESVEQLTRPNLRAEIAVMTGGELAVEAQAAANNGDHARLHLLRERIRHEGAAHINDAGWSTAKSRMQSALASVTTEDHKLLPKVQQIREAAQAINDYASLIARARNRQAWRCPK